MGCTVGWYSVPTSQTQDALDALGLERTENIGNWGDTEDWCLLEMDNGQTLLIRNREWPDHREMDAMEKLSAKMPIGLFAGDESTNGSLFHWMESGKVVWGVEWSGLEGVEDGDLDVMGTWPEFATKILEACRQKQEEEGNDVDIMFDVAVRLGQNIAGFQYGRSLPDNREDRCVYLKSTKSTQPILAKAKGEVRGPVIDVDLEDEEEKKPSLIWRLLGLLAVIGLVILVIYETQRRGEFPSRFVASLFRALM